MMTHVLADIWMPTAQELQLFGPELALVGTIIAVLIAAMVVGRQAHAVAGVALVGMLAMLGLNVPAARQVLEGGLGGMSPLGASPILLADNFSVFFKLFITVFLALVIGLWLIGLTSRGDRPTIAAARQSPPEFLVLLLTSALGMSLMVSTLNLLVIIIAIETASLPSYAIVASDKRSRLGAEASLKYVLFGAATAAIMVYGTSLLYGAFHTLDLSIIAAKLAAGGVSAGPVAWLGLVGLCVGIAFKISAVPVHFWCPDVFEGAPIEVTTWLSVASKAAGLGLLLRIVHTLAGAAGFDLLTPLAWGIGIVAAVTCTVGNLAALRQTSVKRMLAYSSIAHAGYMMMAAAIVLPARSSYGSPVAALIAYLLVYLLMNLGAFGVTAMVVWQTGRDDMNAFAGLGRRAPWLALPMAVCLFSLIGLPPLGGFAAKWWLLIALGKAAPVQLWLWGLIIVAVVNTAISLYYYVGVIRRMYLTDNRELPPFEAPVGGVVLVNACALMLLLLGTVLFNPLGQRAAAYAANLYQPTDTTETRAEAVTMPDLPRPRTVSMNQSAGDPVLGNTQP